MYSQCILMLVKSKVEKLVQHYSGVLSLLNKILMRQTQRVHMYCDLADINM